MGLSRLRVFHKKHGARSDTKILESRASNCTNGLYLAPKMGDTVNSLQPLPITWDRTCLTNKDIDIYLISPNADYPRIHLWQNVALSRGTYSATIMPRWWNATASQSLQLSIVPAGQAPFLSTFPAGPIFTATYAKPSSGTPASADTSLIDSGVTPVNDSANATKGMTRMTPGKTGAAVLFSLLLILLCAGAYVKIKRTKGLEKRKAWTEAIDKRMSTISTDWKSVSGAGANAAIRNSMAVGSRNSSFSFGALRPSSTFAVEGEDSGLPKMSQVRTGTGVGLRNPAALSSTERVSRVSFAPDTRQSRASLAHSRPSGESRRTRAFHSAYIPPVPGLPDLATQDNNENEDAEDTGASFSPRQTQGPLTLTPEDIQSRIPTATTKTKNGSQDKSEFADFMPALSLMRTGTNNPFEPDDFLLSAPSAPAAAFPKPITSAPPQMTSPVMSTMPMQPMPANVMSPDEMLRAYAERKKSMSAAKGGISGVSGMTISYPLPAANAGTPSTNNNMRVLYNAASGVVSPTNTGDVGAGGTFGTLSAYDAAYGEVADQRPTTYYATSEYSSTAAGSVVPEYASQYSTADQNQYAFGHHPNGAIGVGAYGDTQYAIGDEEEDVGVAGRGTVGYNQNQNYAGMGRGV